MHDNGGAEVDLATAAMRNSKRRANRTRQLGALVTSVLISKQPAE